MPKPVWIVEPEQWDAAQVVADLPAIRQYNPQRFEMEQLTAVIYEDLAHWRCVGYKDLAMNEFWVRACALPAPVMPPLLMCEAAAQLANYYAWKHGLYKAQGGFVGLKGVRCRGAARPGERLFVLAELLKVRHSLLTCRFQCAVRNKCLSENSQSGLPRPTNPRALSRCGTGSKLLCEGILIGGVFPWLNAPAPQESSNSRLPGR